MYLECCILLSVLFFFSKTPWGPQTPCLHACWGLEGLVVDAARANLEEIPRTRGGLRGSQPSLEGGRRMLPVEEKSRARAVLAESCRDGPGTVTSTQQKGWGAVSAGRGPRLTPGPVAKVAV